MDSYRRAYAKVDLDAIKHNLTVTKKALKDNMKLAAVVKADVMDTEVFRYHYI